MAGIRGRSGPPGNQNAFRHGLARVAQRRSDGVLNPAEQSIREEILFDEAEIIRWEIITGVRSPSSRTERTFLS